jgi:hypothetical protein
MDFLPLVIFLLGCGVITCLIFFLSNGKSHRPPTYDDGYTCGSKGCVKVKNGDYPSEDVCVESCTSFLKQGSNCLETKGVPWNSYATKKLCMSNISSF